MASLGVERVRSGKNLDVFLNIELTLFPNGLCEGERVVKDSSMVRVCYSLDMEGCR